MTSPAETHGTEGRTEGHNALPHDQTIELSPQSPESPSTSIPPQFPETPVTPTPAPDVPPAAAAPDQPLDPEVLGGQEEPAGFYNENDDDPAYADATAVNANPTPAEISWTAAEFVAHPKTAGWYVAFILATLVVLVLAYIISRDIVTVIVILVAAGLFGYMASHKPRELSYGLSSTGIYVGDKFYPYRDFNAFAVDDQGSMASIDLVPLKRFAPMLSIYCDQKHESSVLDILSQHLPFAPRQRSAIDGLMHRIRF